MTLRLVASLFSYPVSFAQNGSPKRLKMKPYPLRAREIIVKNRYDQILPCVRYLGQ